MQRLFQLLAILSICSLSMAQESNDEEIKTLFGNKNKTISHGGYGAFGIGYTQVADRDAILLGGKGAWIMNHSFGLGLAGYGIISEPQTDSNLDENKDYEFAGGYGGILLEPILMGKSPVHLSFPLIIGAGGISYISTWQSQEDYKDDNYKELYEDSDAYFVLEPGIELEFNLLKFFRLAVSGSYRYTSNIDLQYSSGSSINDPIAPNDMLRGWNFGLVMKFGSF